MINYIYYFIKGFIIIIKLTLKHKQLKLFNLKLTKLNTDLKKSLV